MMAARCRSLMRSTLQGLYQLSNRTLWRGSHSEQMVCLRLQENVFHCRALHCGHYTLQTGTKTEPPRVMNTQKATEPENLTNQQKREEEEEENDNRPEYMPKGKAKNPMIKIGYAWMIGLPSGIIGFILAKRQVDKNRLKQLKIRQRMKRANEGDYETNRYKAATGME